MPTFPASELSYVGGFAHEPREYPVLCQPVLRHDPTGVVFVGDGAGDDEVTVDETFENVEAVVYLMKDSDITVFEKPIPYRPDTCLVMWSKIHVASHRSAVRAMKRYGRIQTVRGDACLRATDALAALWFYERVAAVLQTPASYARMLMCPMPEDREQRIREMLVEGHPERDSASADAIVAQVMEKVRQEIFP
jgi:hypothetical protein